MHKIDYALASSAQVEDDLGKHLEQIRLRRNISQQQLAAEAGVSRSTIARLSQPGKGVSLDSFIRIIQALNLQGALQNIFPAAALSPVEMMQQNSALLKRRRARRSQSHAWQWEQEGDG